MKVLGVFGVVKSALVVGTTDDVVDWHVLAIDIRDALASQLHSTEDVNRCCPGLIRATVGWFRYVESAHHGHRRH